MPTTIYHIQSDIGCIHDSTATKAFLDEWEFSVQPDVITDPEHELHTGKPFIAIANTYSPPLMIEHKTEDGKHEHEFYTALTEYLTTQFTITERQIHPEETENTIVIDPETGVTYK